eukprot:TRINITY_DN1292_c0_g1_i2.p1 TRINITY_DN1292_c0_g1~~TRINITY_DN1292_c0_g1_i2.p1  ORF type:complete len:109 (+),score=12.63 TRINITY_DN1292_c0_g1_i2:69-395(+)
MKRTLIALAVACALSLSVIATPISFVASDRLSHLAQHFTRDSTEIQTWFAGASANTINPPVRGRTDYVVPVSEFDAESPGTFVLRFDQGRISVGNGAREVRSRPRLKG